MSLKDAIYNETSKEEFTVMNNAVYMNLIDKYGFEQFKSNLYQLESEDKIYFDYSTDGMMIYRK